MLKSGSWWALLLLMELRRKIHNVSPCSSHAWQVTGLRQQEVNLYFGETMLSVNTSEAAVHLKSSGGVHIISQLPDFYTSSL